jgi:F-type H+-transporting ATPase subunit b
MHFDVWTLALQTINVLVLVWLLSRFLYRPLLAAVDARRAENQKAREEAERARREAADLRAQAAAAAAENTSARERLIAEAQAIARREAEAETAKAADQIRKLKDEAADDIAKARRAAQDDLTSTASALAVDIARRLLGRLPADASVAGFLAGLCDEARKLSPQMRDGFDGEVELLSAAPLTPATLAEARAALENAFGHPLALTSRVDPTLLAGFELRAAHAAISNSWKTDLDQVAKELTRDSRQ